MRSPVKCFKMATTFGAGGQSPNSLSRSIERVFEEAQHTGEIILSGRKLREYPKIASKYDLADTISADLSKNRFSEIPKELCEYVSMERLNCYSNVIKSIPEVFIQLQALTYVNLSRNQLSVLPSFISQLQALEVLIAGNNKLVSLPEEIGILDKLMELDVSCNEISQLPVTIGDLRSLKSLNVRRNMLVELPLEISKLNLRKLDFSCNRISRIPTVFRKIETIEEIVLDHNPLILPPAHVCTKGRQHILKYLHDEAIREDKKRGILNEVEMKRYRKSLPPQQSISSDEFRNLVDSPENKWKRHTVLSSDSGYSTTDSLEKCGWSSEVNGEFSVENNTQAFKPVEVIRDQRPIPDIDLHRRITHERSPMAPAPPPNEQSSTSLLPRHITPGQASAYISGHYVSVSSPTTSQLSPVTITPFYPPNPPIPVTSPTPQGPGPGMVSFEENLEDEFTRELQRQKQEYERKKKVAEQLRLQQEEEMEKEERRRAALRVQEEQRALLERQQEEFRLKEELRIQEELRQAEAQRQEELRRLEALRVIQEAQEQKNKKPGLNTSGSFKEERKSNSISPYRRTVSDSAHRLQQVNGPANSQISAPTVITNGPYGDNTNEFSPVTTLDTSVCPSPNTSFDMHDSTPPHPAQNVPPTRALLTDSHPTTQQSSAPVGTRRTKVSDKLPSASSTGSVRPTGTADRHGRVTSGSTAVRASGLQAPRKNHLTSRSGSTSSEDDKKHPASARSSISPASSTSSLQKSRTGMSKTSTSTSKPTSKVSKTAVASTTSKSAGLSKPAAPSGQSKLQTNPSIARGRRPSAGTGASDSNVKIEDLKNHNPSLPVQRQQGHQRQQEHPRQQEHQKDEMEHIEMLRKTMETRLKRSLPDNLPEALSDGVLLCHLANQIRPRSVASVHVPSPAVPKLTTAKCRRNVDNFLDACRKIGVKKEQICAATDILEEKGISRIAATVTALIVLSKTPRSMAV
ncbi:hypothetical protein ACJMK2_017937 [Sinanodonta woodiana]|uniref:Calponin-homology (CH) domain-containing protein n=1 Tax=Sinanodonta woodiana TaxID=1069815 RepID=A0ABD3UEK2_SINWO